VDGSFVKEPRRVGSKWRSPNDLSDAYQPTAIDPSNGTHTSATP
jgi:hypothetical protein